MSITVSTLVKYLKNKLDSDDKLQNVVVTGELSNFSKYPSGHMYFTLKDEKSQIACVMFSYHSSSLDFKPKDGDKVEVCGCISIYEVSGKLQINVSSMRIAGVGDLYKQYIELKDKLSKEGLFDDDHKIDMPTDYPMNVCVLVGDKSAAMSDIKTCFKRRWPLCNVDYYPVLVQGQDAPKVIINTLLNVDKLNYEIIVLARGGGSFEDLFCFNDESLVRTIYNLKTFIITGIGHEKDFTLCDFVADKRAATPTAAVELITPDINDLRQEIDSLKNALNISISSLIENYEIKLDSYASKIKNYSNKLKLTLNKIDNYKDKLENSINYLIEKYKNELSSKDNLLKAYSIDNTLKRGYSLVYKNTKLIKKTKDLRPNDEVNIKMYAGSIKASIKG